MILTEEEAKTKWCPEARANAGRTAIGTTLNRDDNGAPFVGCYCIGSACMAWRWRDPAPEIEIFVAGEGNADFVRRRDRILAGRVGYCGKAGAP